MEIAVKRNDLPEEVVDLSQFVLVGRERLTAVRAAIRAIDKVGVASEVYQQKLAEGQDIAEAVLDAEVRLGELRKNVERKQGGDRKSAEIKVLHVQKFDSDTPLRAFDKSAQLDKSVASQLETLAGHPAIVERVKAEARENGELVTRQDVLNAIKAEKKAAEIEQARKDIAEQAKADANAPILYIGDSIGLKLAEKVDLLLTDPPYSTDVDDIDAFVARWLFPALDNVKSTGFAYVCIGAYPSELRAYLSAKIPEHMTLTQVLTWTYKNTLGNNPRDRYKQNYQAILFYRGKDAPELDCPLTSEQWAVQEINAPDGRVGDRYHAWQKPMELGERFVRHATRPGMTVYDPFACTGTFLLAAAKLGRRAFGYEISEDNAKIAIERGCVLA